MSWQQIQTSSATVEVRSSHSVTTIGKKIYVFGGEDNTPRHPFSNKFVVYDLEKQAWEEANAKEENAPPKILAHTATAVGKDIYLFGGRNADKQDLNIFYKFNTETNEWTNLSELPNTPEARSYHAAASLDDRYLYIFGGCGAPGRLNDLHEFDTQTNTWKEVTPYVNTKNLSEEELEKVPKIRGGSQMVGVNLEGKRMLYLFGGFTGHQLDDMYRINLDAESVSWERVNPKEAGALVPPPRSVHVFVKISEDELFLFGGEKEASARGHEGAGLYYSDIYIYNIPKNEWRSVKQSGDVPTPRAWLVADAIRTEKAGAHYQIAMFGGFDGQTRLNDLFVFSVQE